MNLILALVWLFLATFLFALHLADREPPGWRIGGVPLYGIALAFFVWNVLRWLSVRGARRAPEPSWRERLRRPRAEPGERNPNFMFDEPPPTGTEDRSRGEGQGGK
jgi:hypothetical protein